MGCILRLAGVKLDVDGLLRNSPLTPYRVDRKGQPRALRSRPPHADSGVHFSVSDRDFTDLRGQIVDAISYLETNQAAIRQLREFPGVESAGLDFGIARRDVAAQFDSFPSKLLRLAGNLGLDLDLSQYPVGESLESEATGA